MSLLASKRNQIIALAAVLLAFVMIYVNFVSPAREERAAKEAQLAQKRKELGEMEKRLGVSGSLKAKEQAELAKVRSRIPEAPYLESLLRDMRMLEVVSRLSMAHYHFEVGTVPGDTANGHSQAGAGGSAPASGGGTAANSGGASELKSVSPLAVPIRLNTTVKGDYARIRRMLEEVQTMGRLITVEQISFRVESSPPVKLNATDREITCNVSLMSYYAPGLKRFFQTPVPIDYTGTGQRSRPL